MTDLYALERIERSLLNKHDGNAVRAVPDLRRLLLKRHDLLDALILAHLETLVDNPLPGHSKADAHEVCAGKAAAGQTRTDAQSSGAGGGPTPKPVHEHRRAPARTDEDRQIAILAMTKNLRGWAHPILGRALGNYSRRELFELRRELPERAAGHVMLGIQFARDAVLIDKVLCHVVADDDVKVRDMVSEETLIRFEDEAKRETKAKLGVSKVAARNAFVEQLEYRPS